VRKEWRERERERNVQRKENGRVRKVGKEDKEKVRKEESVREMMSEKG
jgi:hypothetical protein